MKNKSILIFKVVFWIVFLFSCNKNPGYIETEGNHKGKICHALKLHDHSQQNFAINGAILQVFIRFVCQPISIVGTP